MSKINIERTIYGSLSNSIGDDTIVYSNGSSKEAEIFRTLLDSDANKKLASNYASLFLYWSPISRCHTFLHIQGSHVEFKADGRSFCTRGIYEISSKDMESIKYDYLSVLDSIPHMSRMEKFEYGINPQTDVTPILYEEEKLDNNEKLLLGLVYTAILNNKKLLIKIKAVDDEYKENNVLTSTRLKAILKIISLLPSKIAQYASVAFSVDASLCKMLDKIISPLIIAHQDAVLNWNDEDILIANWEYDELKTATMENFNFLEDERVVKEIIRLPLLSTYMEQNPNKQLSTYSYVSIVRQHLDAVLDDRSIDKNDIALLNLAYTGCEDKAAYRHEAMASKLYDLIFKNQNAISSPKDTMAKIEREYHLSRKKPIGNNYYEEQINHAQNVKEIEQLLEQTDCTVEIGQVVIRKVCSNWDFIEDVICNNDKYKLVGERCKDSIHKKIVNDSFEKILKYYNHPYVGITIEDVKKKANNWQAIYDACEVVGWEYATSLFVVNKYWSVHDISEYNKWYNLISPKIDFNKQPVVLKLFADLLKSLMRNKTFSQCCDIVLQLDSNRVFEISSIIPKQLGDNSQKKLKKIYEQKPGYYDYFKNEYERLTEQQVISWSFILSTFKNNVSRTQLSDLTPEKIASIAIKEGLNHKVLDLCEVLCDYSHKTIYNHLLRSAEIIASDHIEQMINNNNLAEELLINFEALPTIQTVRECWQNCYLNAFKLSSHKDLIAETFRTSSDNASREYSEFLFKIIESLKTDESVKPFYKKFFDKFVGETKSNKEGYGVSYIRRYHLDNLLVAILTGAIVFLCSPYIYPNHQKTEINTNIGLGEVNNGINDIVTNTDTLFFDADLNQNKISRGLLLRLSESVITRIGEKNDLQSIHPVICFHGDSVYIVPLINTPVNDLVKIDSLLFGKSLVSTNNAARKDSVVVVENGEQKKKILNGKNRLLSQLRRNMLTVNEVKIDAASLFIPNELFKDKYDVEPNSRHLLYYLFIVREMEQFKKNNGINHELSY